MSKQNPPFLSSRSRYFGFGRTASLAASLLLTVGAATGAALPNKQADVVETGKGPLKITPLYHGSVMLEFGGKVIHVDPWSQADYTGLPQADIIVISHTHADHMDSAQIKALKKDTTLIVTSEAVNDTLNGCCGEVETIRNGEKKTFRDIEFEGVAMYNLNFGPAPGKPWHHKGIGNGYVLHFGSTNVYFSGDTECVPEMKALKDISVAFVAMNPPRTMPAAEAAACVKEFRPKVVYPYHYRGQNTQEFADALKGTGIEVRLRKLEGEAQ
ncbi:MAG: MBL fold metallo-hydrolase [Bryobacteraceae bacterium]